ncbi:hypothetical protein KCP75_04075 [Salmonella enterica subsp. enterica]|nr:hypothetical protein KCP75_04075 [Salmonella enterica subsp. enterica]
MPPAAIGTRKLHYLLNMQADKTLNIGRDRLFNLLGEYRLTTRETGISQNHQQPSSLLRHPNLLKPGP